MSQLQETYGQLVSLRERVAELREEVVKLREAAFGEVSAEEDIAKKFFSELALSTDQIRNTERDLHEKKNLLRESEKRLKEVEEAFLKILTRLKFPLKLGSEGIEKNDNEIIFHFDEEIEKGILDEIRAYLGDESLCCNKVEIQTDKIVARNVENVSDAMKEVMSHVESKIWKAATGILEVDKYVVELKNRDEKIQKMLYTLLESGDKPLSKKEMEAKSNLEPGALRGVLYFVLKRDPYMKEVEKGRFLLTEIGKRVMQRYHEKYGSPIRKEKVSTKTLVNYDEKIAKRG